MKNEELEFRLTISITFTEQSQLPVDSCGMAIYAHTSLFVFSSLLALIINHDHAAFFEPEHLNSYVR